MFSAPRPDRPTRERPGGRPASVSPGGCSPVTRTYGVFVAKRTGRTGFPLLDFAACPESRGIVRRDEVSASDLLSWQYKGIDEGVRGPRSDRKRRLARILANAATMLFRRFFFDGRCASSRLAPGIFSIFLSASRRSLRNAIRRGPSHARQQEPQPANRGIDHVLVPEASVSRRPPHRTPARQQRPLVLEEFEPRCLTARPVARSLGP